MHLPTLGLLIVSSHVSQNCPVSSTLAFEDTTREPVHKSDVDYYKIFNELPSHLFVLQPEFLLLWKWEYQKEMETIQWQALQLFLPLSLGQELPTAGGSGIQDALRTSEEQQ